MSFIRRLSGYAVRRTLSGLDRQHLITGAYIDTRPRPPKNTNSQSHHPQNQKIGVDFEDDEKDAHPNIEGEWGGTPNKAEVPTVNGAGEITPGEPE